LDVVPGHARRQQDGCDVGCAVPGLELLADLIAGSAGGGTWGGDPRVLFTDIEGSTALLGRLGDDGYARVLAGHHALMRVNIAG
jgi:class 3 adenylate cyclase